MGCWECSPIRSYLDTLDTNGLGGGQILFLGVLATWREPETPPPPLRGGPLPRWGRSYWPTPDPIRNPEGRYISAFSAHPHLMRYSPNPPDTLICCPVT